MKKVVSLLVALATAFGVNATVFAATDDIISFSETSTASFIAPRVNYGNSNDVVSLVENEIVIVTNDTKEEIIMPESHLEPGKEYSFKVFMSTANQTNVTSGAAAITAITDQMLGGGKFRIQGKGGTSAIEKIEIKKRGTGPNATYRLDITTKETWGTKLNDIEYIFSVIKQTEATAHTIENGNLTLKVGYQKVSDEEVEAYDEGDTITISQDYPVYTREHFKTIAKNTNYKTILLEDEDNEWSFLGRVSGMGDTNFKYTRDVIPAIVERFPDQEFEFFTFGGGVNFPTHGEFRLDVGDFAANHNKIYTYLYRNGTLTPINTTYDIANDELVFRTNYLGSFVITNEQITDTSIVEKPEEEKPTEKPETENPSTGASAGMNLAIALGLTSLAAISITRKK